jgi:hypothetical protein
MLATIAQALAWPRTSNGALFASEAYNGLPYASSDQLARNIVQHTRLLTFSANAQKFRGLRRQKPKRGLCDRRKSKPIALHLCGVPPS